MSGGSFNHAYSHVRMFADDLADKLTGRDIDGSMVFDNPAVGLKLAEIQQQAQQLAGLMRAAEWLYSGDYGDESFLAAVRDAEQNA